MKTDPNLCAGIFIPVVADGIKFNRRARCHKKSPGQGPLRMTKSNTAVKTEGKTASTALMNVMKAEPDKNGSPKAEEKVTPVQEPKKEPTIQERIQKVENLKLLVDKRSRLVETRNQLNNFQVASSDFNCQMVLQDSDGNKFSTSFTPGIKKVIDFLKGSFDSSIAEVDGQIQF